MSIWSRNPMRHYKDVVFALEGVYDASHQIKEKVSGAIYVEVPLNLIDIF